ncbi:unnamed protein product [Leptidea sinapis]|uniref:Integrin beta n=1 Tax=Leptidea sinapis TaxID=189913 RepID=A0A5E4QJ59_9NEOP|nr:unnamed protein product [Leptidea sinapis]
MTIIKDEDFSAGLEGAKVVQFKPQKVYIKSRPGFDVKIDMSYKPAKDYPLNIYFLLDSSYTMKENHGVLLRQVQKIYKKLINLTNNVRFGLGNFLEKPALPFADPKLGQNVYAFEHRLSMTNDMAHFQKTLNATKFSANYDVPEAGLDALMQVMVCKDKIDWDDNARRIVILFTDGTYHSAGDGKLIGISERNDMQCHLENNTYSKSLNYDYPSLSLINKVASEKNMKIIFAIDKNEKLTYKSLAKRIKGAKYVNLKSNIVNIIKGEYLSLLRDLKIHGNVPPFIQLLLEPDCTKEKSCEVKHETAVNISGSIKIQSCPAKDQKKYFMTIGPDMLSEKMEVEIDVDCQCDCEKDGNNEKNSIECSGAGTYKCGVCACDMNRCGKCDDCEKGFSGDFCQFDDNACPRPGGALCSGNGVCEFGRCTCNQQWKGDDCRCPDNDKACIAPISSECVCKNSNETKKKCSGRFCDDCDDMVEKRCAELETFAYCNYVYTKTECEKLYNHTDTGVRLENETEIAETAKIHKVKWCKKLLDNGNSLIFLYYYPKSTEISSLEVVVQKELEEKPEVDLWVAVGCAIGIVLIGILTVIAWKYLIDLHDAREYKKFEQKSAAEGYEVVWNPHYNSPFTNITNPAYPVDTVDTDCSRQDGHQ